MPDHSSESNEIRETDIVFDCPHCGKSLAIDYRGAGLTIPCSDCGESVSVPIPDGMELSDIDSSEQDQEIRIMNLRRALVEAEEKMALLDGNVEELKDRCGRIEKARATAQMKLASVHDRINVIQKSLRDIEQVLTSISETAKQP